MNTNETINPMEDERTSTEIESNIRHTRDRMDSTIDELGNRLTPRSLMNSAMDWWEKNSTATNGKSGFRNGYRAVASQVKSHPVPALLIGAGVAWLLLNPEEDEEDQWTSRSRYPSGRPYGSTGYGDPYTSQPEEDEDDGPGVIDRIKAKAQEAGDAVSGMVDTAKSKAGDLSNKASHLKDRAREMKDKARGMYREGGDRAHDATEKLRQNYDATMEQARHAMDEYPLAVGAAFFAMGALAGVLLPRTRREDELMGTEADSFKEAAKSKGEEILEEGKTVAENIGSRVMDDAAQKGLTPGSAGSKLSELASDAGDVVRKAVGEVSDAVKPDSPSYSPSPPSPPLQSHPS